METNESNYKNEEATCQVEVTDRAAEVLRELSSSTKDGCGDMYLRCLNAVKNRLVMDDEYEPTENLSLLRVLTMLESDLRVLCCRTEPAED